MRLPPISWSSVIAGSIASLVVYLILNLIWLGFEAQPPLAAQLNWLAVGVQGFETGSAFLLVITVALALFAGTFAAGRILPFTAAGHGLRHGLLIATIFFWLLPVAVPRPLGPGVFQGGPNVPLPGPAFGGPSGSGLSVMVGELGVASAGLASQPEVTGGVSQVLGGRAYSQPLPLVTGTVIGFLGRSDSLGAVNYLSAQGVPLDQAQRLAESARGAFQERMNVVRARVGGMVTALAWSFLITILLGAGAAVLGITLGGRTAAVIEELEREEVSRAA